VDDPASPVTVAVPSNYAGLSLRRALARPVADDRGGLLNVRFLVLARVIELLGAPVLAARGQEPLTPALRAELIRDVLQQSPGVFESVAGHPATEQSLEATFRDLAEMTDDRLAVLARTGTQVADVVRLFDAVRGRARDRYYDDTALAVAAAEAARSGHAALRDLGTLVVCAPGPLNRVEREFIEALGETHEVFVLLAMTGDALADAPALEQWSDHLRGNPRERVPQGALPSVTNIVSAPDAEEEVRQAVRMALAAVEAGTPLHRIAFLSRHASPYVSLFAAQLDAARIPWNGRNPGTVAQSVSGRALLGLLNLPGRRYSRAAVSAWLSSAPIQRGTGGMVPAHRWDEVARNAGIVREAAEWRSRLDRYALRLEREVAGLETADDPAEWRRARLERDREEALALREFMEALFAVMGREFAGSWESFATWSQGLLDQYLGTEAALVNRLPGGVEADAEVEAYRAVREALESLAGLVAVRQTVDLETFRRVLQRELDRPARRLGRFGEGIFVGRLVDAASTDFDHIFIFGMNEGAVPPKGSDDPLLPDAVWDVVAGGTTARPRRARRRSEERRSYLAALASAREYTLLAPRADLRGQQGRLRSRWLLEAASRKAGRRLTNADMDTLDVPWHIQVPSFDAALRTGDVAASKQERDLRSIRRWREAGRRLETHPLVAQEPGLGLGWEAQQARRSRTFTRWDGGVGALPPAAVATVVEREQSPTSLERWARCPRQYLFATVLGVSEREDPEQVLSISPADRGTLIHDVLQRFINERQLSSPAEPWSEADRERLAAIAEEECERWEQAGMTGAPLLWRLDRARILRDIEAFADVDHAYRTAWDVLPVATELAIGGAAPVSVDLGDGRIVRLRGRIDRVDRSPDGMRTVVIDYKTGSAWPYRGLDEDPVQRGRLLQLPVYALGARAQYGRGEVAARYWFTREDVEDRYRFAGYVVDEGVEVQFREALGRIISGVAGGVFPAEPGAQREAGAHEHCMWCPYDAVCSTDRARERERKADDPALTPFRALAGTPDTEPMEEDGS
jgi:ATP-dependent helicase/nuclease subunit B